MRRCTWDKRRRADGMADDFEARLTVCLPAHVFFCLVDFGGCAGPHSPISLSLTFQVDLV